MFLVFGFEKHWFWSTLYQKYVQMQYFVFLQTELLRCFLGCAVDWLVVDWFSIRTRSLVFKVETVELPPEKDLDINVLTLCAIFRTKYMQHCKESILSKKR